MKTKTVYKVFWTEQYMEEKKFVVKNQVATMPNEKSAEKLMQSLRDDGKDRVHMVKAKIDLSTKRDSK